MQCIVGRLKRIKGILACIVEVILVYRQLNAVKDRASDKSFYCLILLYTIGQRFHLIIVAIS